MTYHAPEDHRNNNPFRTVFFVPQCGIMEVKMKKGVSKFNFDSKLMLIPSLLVALLAWQLVSMTSVGVVIVGPAKTFGALIKTINNGSLWTNIWASLERVFWGFLLGAACAIPLAILLGWYKVFRSIVEPWLQFLRTIPPIALCPMVIALFGVGLAAKVAIIFFAVLLVMVITIYQGVKNVDVTLIKAARVLGATEREIFFDIIVPASFPFILVGVRLGLAAALSTLIAAELTGATYGLGNMIQVAASYFNMDIVMLGVAVIGTIGFVLDKFVLFLERKLTGWQETIQ